MAYTVPLALFDFVPVVFTGAALYWIVRMVGFVCAEMGRTVTLGALLVVAGGSAKAAWKFLMAVSGGALDVRWLDNSLFVLMAPGFLLLAFGVWGMTRIVRRLSATPARVLGPLSVVVTLVASAAFALIVPESPAWNRVLLGMMVTAALGLNALFIVFAVRERLVAATLLLAINLVATLVLSYLARLPDQTISLQWIEQSVNSASWLAFAIASGMVYAHTRVRYGVDADAAECALTTEVASA